jgi:Flp pilus assembly protein TadG
MSDPMLRLIQRRRKNGEKGQALAEFALLIPIFLMLMFAIVDFGMGFYSWITVTNSAREGARVGAVHAPLNVASSPCFGKASLQQCIEDRVLETAGLADQATKMTVTITNAQGQSGESVVVKVDYDYDLITPLAGLVNFISGDTIGPTLNLSSTADMRLE